MKKKKNSFVGQAMFLSVSGIIVRVIGVLYGIPLTNIIGDLGNGYYASAYNVYSMVLLICSYSIPMAVSKIMSEKMALGQYITAHRVFKCALFYVICVGGSAFIVSWIFAPQLVDVPEAILAMRVLAPTIFFSGILSVFRGYFQAQNTMIPTAISQIIEQILNAIFSVAVAYFLVKMHNEDKNTVVAQYGAAGAATGTGVGVMAGLIFVIFTYLIYYPVYKRHYLNGTENNIVGYKRIFTIILYMVTPVILGTCIYNISTVLDMKIFYKISAWKKENISDTVKFFGIFSRKYLPLANVPIAVSSSMVSALVPEISTSYAKKNMTEVRSKIDKAVRVSMLLVIPASCGLVVLSKPIIVMLYGKIDNIAIGLLRGGSIYILFSGISTVYNGVLQGIGQVRIPMKNAVMALSIQASVLVILMIGTEFRVYGLLMATTLYVVIISVLNYRKIRSIIHYRQELKKTFFYPAISAIGMGVFVVVLNYGITYFMGRWGGEERVKSFFVVIMSMSMASIVYFMFLIFIGYDKDELQRIPLLSKVFKIKG